MGKAPAFQLYAADFYMDTGDWSNEEIGIYFRLLMHEWISGPLDNDMERLARIAKTSPTIFKKNWKKISEKFIPSQDQKLSNKRLEETRSEQDNYRKLQKEKSILGVEARRKKQPTDEPTGKPDGKPLQSSSSTSKDINIKLSKDNSSSDDPKTTICPHREIVSLYHEVLPMLPRVKEWTPPRQAMLRKRWSEKKERQDINWWREFFVDISKSDFLTGKIERDDGRPPFTATLEWLIKPSNFIKVIEGKYGNRGGGKELW